MGTQPLPWGAWSNAWPLSGGATMPPHMWRCHHALSDLPLSPQWQPPRRGWFGWWTAPVPTRDGWRSSTTDVGARCATTAGTRRMETWCAGCWASEAPRRCTAWPGSAKVRPPPPLPPPHPHLYLGPAHK